MMKKIIVFLLLGCLLTVLACYSFAEMSAGQPQASVLLKPSEVTLQKGRSFKISVTLVNNPKNVRLKKTEWVSSDPDVAVCSGGTVKGISAGKTVITCNAILSDGTVLTEECPVTVTVIESFLAGLSFDAAVRTAFPAFRPVTLPSGPTERIRSSEEEN